MHYLSTAFLKLIVKRRLLKKNKEFGKYKVQHNCWNVWPPIGATGLWWSLLNSSTLGQQTYSQAALAFHLTRPDLILCYSTSRTYSHRSQGIFLLFVTSVYDDCFKMVFHDWCLCIVSFSLKSLLVLQFGWFSILWPYSWDWNTKSSLNIFRNCQSSSSSSEAGCLP